MFCISHILLRVVTGVLPATCDGLFCAEAGIKGFISAYFNVSRLVFNSPPLQYCILSSPACMPRDCTYTDCVRLHPPTCFVDFATVVTNVLTCCILFYPYLLLDIPFFVVQLFCSLARVCVLVYMHCPIMYMQWRPSPDRVDLQIVVVQLRLQH